MDEHTIKDMALRMRKSILDISHTCNMSAHLGGGLSMVDITATLYGAVMRYRRDDPTWDGRDRFILSKGHGVLGYFSALLAAGIISDDVFQTFQTNGSDLIAHPVMNMGLGIESSNGSLGQGLSLCVGLALAAKKQGKDHKIYVLLGDGECNEGAVWEAIMLAAQLKLDNLVAVVDYNKLQSDGEGRLILDYQDFEKKWDSFGWNVHSVDGHDIAALLQAFNSTDSQPRPKVLVAHTVKGKGIAFMENNNDWHHNRLTRTHYEQALQALGVA